MELKLTSRDFLPSEMAFETLLSHFHIHLGPNASKAIKSFQQSSSFTFVRWMTHFEQLTADQEQIRCEIYKQLNNQNWRSRVAILVKSSR